MYNTLYNKTTGALFRFVYMAPLVVILLVLNACGTHRLLSPVVPDRAAEQVLSAMHATQPAFEHFSARYSGNVTIFGEQTNIGGTIRIRRDSAILISVAPVLGIEVARILVTPNHVKVLNRLESTYFEGNMSVINNMLNANVDFSMLQSILLGNDFSHFSTDHFKVSPARDMLLLQNPERKRLAPIYGASTTYEHNMWIDNQSYRILQSQLRDNNNDHSMNVQYPSHTTVQGKYFPAELMASFYSSSSNASLSIRYSRIAIDQPQQITFSVPERYREMDF